MINKYFRFISVITLLAAVLLINDRNKSVQAQDPLAAIIAQVEGKQSASDSLTLLEEMQKYHVPGLSVAVIKDSKIHWSKGYGVADVETNEPVKADTLFQAASISKPVTAMAVLKAAQDGRILLDDDVNKMLTSWKVPPSEFTKATPVTPRSLLSHTSGADDGLGFPGYDPSQPRPTLQQIIKGEKPANTKPVLFARAPFVAYKYSGGGLTIMQLALMEALHKPFAEIMSKTVLAPLGMQNSTYEQPIPAALEAKTARAHNSQGETKDAKWHIYPEQAAAGLWTTPSDLARVAIEIQQAVNGAKSQVLSRKMAHEMITPVGVGPFAVGMTIDKRGEGWYFSHGGSNWGFRCQLIAHLRKGYGIVIMTNGDNGQVIIKELMDRVALAYKWDLLDKPLTR